MLRSTRVNDLVERCVDHAKFRGNMKTHASSCAARCAASCANTRVVRTTSKILKRVCLIASVRFRAHFLRMSCSGSSLFRDARSLFFDFVVSLSHVHFLTFVIFDRSL